MIIVMSYIKESIWIEKIDHDLKTVTAGDYTL